MKDKKEKDEDVLKEEIETEEASSEAKEETGKEQEPEEKQEQEDPAEEKKEQEEETEKPSGKASKDRKNVRHKKELQKKDEKIAELTERLQRSAAEFDNFRKRTEKEKAGRYDDGAMHVIEKLLIVVDDFERGLSQVSEEQKNDPFVDGMEKIYKHFLTTLEDLGVKPIEALDHEFDPEFHNAVMHVDEEGIDDNIIVEEFQKGYMYKDTVLRHSMVKVAN